MTVNLKSRILLPAILAIAFSVSFGTYYFYRESANQIESEFLRSSKNIVNVSTKMISSYVTGLTNTLLVESRNQTIVQFASDKNLRVSGFAAALFQLRALVKMFSSIDRAFITDAGGNLIMETTDVQHNFNISDRAWFKKAISGNVVISEPLISKTYGTPVVQICAPIYNNGSMVGVIGITVILEKFTDDVISPIKIGLTGSLMLVADNGFVFSHHDKQLILKYKIDNFEWGKRILSSGEGRIHFAADGSSKTAIFKKDDITHWTVVAVVDDVDAYNIMSHCRNVSLVIACICIILSSAVLFFVVMKIVNDLDKIVRFAREISSGKLDGKLEMSRKDELGVLVNALLKMVDTLKIRLREVEEKTVIAEHETHRARQSATEAEAAKVMADNARRDGELQAAHKLSSVVEIVSDESEQLALQIKHSSKGAEEQSSRIQNVASSIEEINSTIAEVANNSSHAADCAEQVKVKAEQGSDIVGNVMNQVKVAQANSLELNNDMHSLGLQVDGIGEILNAISDIADQTNLLALNAAIEAARAGESGRGFAVVANEVRKLAEKTMKATKDVEIVVNGIQDATKKNCLNVDRISKIIAEITDLSSISGDALQEIVTLADDATTQVKIIAAASNEQTAASEVISDSICVINQISAETTERMQNSEQGIEQLIQQANVLRSLIDSLMHAEDAENQQLSIIDETIKSICC